MLRERGGGGGGGEEDVPVLLTRNRRNLYPVRNFMNCLLHYNVTQESLVPSVYKLHTVRACRRSFTLQSF
jgi:hypothetical protein